MPLPSATKAKTTTNSKPKTNSKPRAKAKTKKKNSPSVPYPELNAKFCVGSNAITFEQMLDLLGWEEEPEGSTFEEYTLSHPETGRRVRLTNNPKNRPFSLSLASTWKQEMLKGRWVVNGQGLIIGTNGSVLSGQHRGVGFILSVLEWRKCPEKYPAWETEPTLSTLVVTGVNETDETVNTIDTGKPRSLADVIYRSIYFADWKAPERKVAARACDFAVRLLWERTGAKADPHAPIRTHGESIDFIGRHDGIMKAVRHIVSEFDGTETGKLISLGYASGLLYLMGTSASDPDTYGQAEIKSEKLLDMSLWEKAEEFWTLFAGEAKETKHLRAAVGYFGEDGEEISTAEKVAIILQGWNLFVQGKSMTPKVLELEYHTDEEEVRHLISNPTAGGIDTGGSAPYVPPAKSEIQANLEAEKARKKGGKAPEDFEIGDEVWVHDEEGNWDGKLMSLYEEDGVQMCQVKVPGGDIFATERENLREYEV